MDIKRVDDWLEEVSGAELTEDQGLYIIERVRTLIRRPPVEFSNALVLYACTSRNGGCGFIGMENFRDGCCPVCKVAMRCNQITITGLIHIESIEAPHTDIDDIEAPDVQSRA